MTIEIIIFYVLLVDSICANLFAMFGERWYTKHFRTMSRWFPLAKGWAIYYLILVLWIGSLLFRLGNI